MYCASVIILSPFQDFDFYSYFCFCYNISALPTRYKNRNTYIFTLIIPLYYET